MFLKGRPRRDDSFRLLRRFDVISRHRHHTTQETELKQRQPEYRGTRVASGGGVTAEADNCDPQFTTAKEATQCGGSEEIYISANPDQPLRVLSHHGHCTN